MKIKLKKVFSINLEPGYRNYTVRDLIDLKGKKKLTQIFVSSAEEAAAAEEAKIDLLLTRPSLDLRKIRQAAPKTFMTVAVPFINYSSKNDIVKKALEIVEIGADSIHCGSWNLNFMKYLNDFKIPFQGHAGLVPRRSTWIGGVRAYGRKSKEAIQIYKDIKDIKDTGAWGVEIECVPEEIVGLITESTSLITLSIGAGKKSDVQFLFSEDILGCSSIEIPRHAKSYRNFNKVYADIQKERVNAYKEFKKDVISNIFPQKKHIIGIEKNELDLFKAFLNKKKDMIV